MLGHIYITGAIGSYFDFFTMEETKGVELVDVISQVMKQPEAERFLVHINSPGGLCSVGHSIYEYLLSIKQPVDTIAEVQCCSMGTVILMAGQNRIAKGNVEFLPHNPWTEGIGGDYEDLQSAADEIKQEEDKIINIYSKVTGISKEGLDLILKENKAIDLQRALELNFFTKLEPDTVVTGKKLKAIAVLKKGNMAEKKELSELKKIVFAIRKALNMVKGLMVSDDQGRQLEVWTPDNMEAGELEVGNVVMIDGAPAPDGKYNIPESGVTIEVLMGAITAVNPIEEIDIDDTEGLAKKIESLEAELKLVKSENDDLKSQVKETEKLKGQISDIEKTISALVGNEPDLKARQQAFSKKKTEGLSLREQAELRQKNYTPKKK